MQTFGEARALHQVHFEVFGFNSNNGWLVSEFDIHLSGNGVKMQPKTFQIISQSIKANHFEISSKSFAQTLLAKN